VDDDGDYVIDLYAVTLEIYVEMRDDDGSVTFKGLVSHNNALTVVGDGDGKVRFPALEKQGVSPILLATEADVTFDVLDTPVSITCAGEGRFRFPGIKTLTNMLLVQEGEVELPNLERAEATIEVSAGRDREAELTLGSADGSRWVERKEWRADSARTEQAASSLTTSLSPPPSSPLHSRL
jgi:hypothetical protein